MGILELLRRLALLGGACTTLWLALFTPQVLLEARRAALVNAQPLPEQRMLRQRGAEWAGFYRSLPAGGAFFPADRGPMAALAPEVDRLFATTRSAVFYLPVRDTAGEGVLEIRYHNQPRLSKAPVLMAYPWLVWCWAGLAAGLAVYILLPWPSRRAEMSLYPRGPLVALDAVGALSAGFFFALPLWMVECTRDAMGAGFRTTLFCWAVAGMCSLFTLVSGRLAAYHLVVEPFGVAVHTLITSRLIPFEEMAAAGYTVRNDIRTGIYLQTRHGDVIRMNWASLLRFEVVMEAIRQARIPAAADIHA